MGHPKPLAFLFPVLALTAIVIGGTALLLLHDFIQEHEAARLADVVKDRARLLESLERHAILKEEAVQAPGFARRPRLTREKILTILREIHAAPDDWGRRGELLLVARERDMVRYLSSLSDPARERWEEIPFLAAGAEVMRRSLWGQSGIYHGPGFRGVDVIAAYEPVSGRNLGLVAQRERGDILAPLFQALLPIGGAMLAFLGLGAVLHQQAVRQSAREVRAGNGRFDALLEGSRDGAFGVDRRGRCLFCNAVGARMLGYAAPGDLTGREMHRLLLAADEVDDEAAGKVLRSWVGPPSQAWAESLFRMADGEALAVTWGSVPFAEEDRVAGAVVIFSDRERPPLGLVASEARYRDLFDRMAVGAVILEREADGGRFLLKDLNRAGEAWDRISRDDVIGQEVSDALPGVRDSGFLELCRRVWESGTPESLTTIFHDRDHHFRWRENDVYKLGSGDLVALYDDVTEAKQAERELTENQRTLTTLMDNLPGMAYRCRNHPHWILEFVSDGCRELTGYAPGDLMGKKTAIFTELAHPNEREAIWEKVHSALVDEQPYKLVYRMRTAGGVEKWVWEQGVGIYSVMGEVLGLEGFISDISERVEAEEKVRSLNLELEERVAKRTVALKAANQEMEAFTYSVSHDLRAPLRGVDGFSRILLEEYGDKLDDEGRRFLERVRAGTQKMGALIDDLLKLSRSTRGDLVSKPFDISAVAQSVFHHLREGDPERIVAFEVEPGIMASGDVRFINAVLENLIGNAWKYTGGKESALIRFGVRKEKGRNGETIYFVEDNGAGFDMRYADKLFAPFQRLHAASEFEGSGVGLATVQRIVHRHGGEVWAESEEGRGATFFFTLDETGRDHA